MLKVLRCRHQVSTHSTTVYPTPPFRSHTGDVLVDELLQLHVPARVPVLQQVLPDGVLYARIVGVVRWPLHDVGDNRRGGPLGSLEETVDVLGLLVA